jgi:hypothetical protein
VYTVKWSDGSVSTRSLNGLARVRKKGDVVDVEDWEDREADGGLVSCSEWPDERVDEKVEEQ